MPYLLPPITPPSSSTLPLQLANHPLLTRRLFPDCSLEAISKAAHRHAIFGSEATLPRIRKELQEYSDFDLQQVGSLDRAARLERTEGTEIVPPVLIHCSFSCVSLV